MDARDDEDRLAEPERILRERKISALETRDPLPSVYADTHSAVRQCVARCSVTPVDQATLRSALHVRDGVTTKTRQPDVGEYLHY